MKRSSALAMVTLTLLLGGTAHAGGLDDFVRSSKTTTVLRPYYSKGQRISERRVSQVTNQTLPSYVEATKRGYLEIVVPSGKGHVYFRYGKDVFDFSGKGLSIGEVRPIGSERYGFLVPLTKPRERALQRYLGRLKRTDGKELGEYDFHGEKGYHCVTWMLRFAFDPKLGDLVSTLGGAPRDGCSMPHFGRFLRRAPLDMILYSNTPKSRKELRRGPIKIVSLAQLERDHAAQIAAQSEGR